jgi:predicted dehydrogenase
MSVPGLIPRAAGRPRVGGLGAGWIGRDRLIALAAADTVEIVAVADPDERARGATAEALPRAALCQELDDLLEHALDGIVIATPSALHPVQAAAALSAGVAVFCEKPLGRTAVETRELLDIARAEDRLLGVDLSYRSTRAAQAMHKALRSGELGEVHAVELVFHNAYGPDKPWFTQRSLSGGGCLLDLGTHLVDLGLWLTQSRAVVVDTAHLTRRGRPVAPGGEDVEDFALAQLHTDRGIVMRVACSWFLNAGRDCIFEATVHGTEGAITMYNLDGSFYDFVAERHQGTSRRRLTEPGDNWGAGAITAWGSQLAADGGFCTDADDLLTLAEAIDAIYEAAR